MRTWRMEKTAGWGKQQGEETAAQIRRQRYGSSEKSIAAGPDDRWAAMRCDEIYEILWLVSEYFEAHSLADESEGCGG